MSTASPPTVPKSVAELIDRFGGPTKFASNVIGTNPSTASEMKRSGSMRVTYWPLVIAEAPKYGIPGVTAETLMKMHVEEADA